MESSRCVVALATTVFCCVQIWQHEAALAQSAPANLDLSSTAASVTANQSATITVDGASHEVTVNDLITPATALAVSQVVGTGSQSIVLGSQFTAIGGSFNLSSSATSGLSSLVIPEGVTAIHDAAELSTVSVSGNFLNSGILQVLSQNAQVSSATLSALSITNQQSGIITSVLSVPIAGYTPALTTIDLNLSAVQSIINAGLISSSASLTATAGDDIVNGLPQGISGTAPAMQAVGNLNLITGAGSLVNSGTLLSTAGNINVAGMVPVDLVINNTSGQMQALLGSISVRDAAFTAGDDLAIIGGKLTAMNVNLFGGDGTVNIDVNEILGLANITARQVSVNTFQNMLNVGEIHSTGSTSITNTFGDVTLHSDLLPGGDLNVRANGGVLNIESQVNLSGKEIFLAASTINLSDAVELSSTAKLSQTTGKVNLVAPTIALPENGEVIINVRDGYVNLSSRDLVITTTGGSASLLTVNRSEPTALAPFGRNESATLVLNGSSVTVNEGVTLASPEKILVRQGGWFQTASFTNNGTLKAGTETNEGTFQINTTSVFFDPDPLSIKSLGNIDLSSGNGGRGGTILIEAIGQALSIAGGVLRVDASAGGDFDGGKIQINAGSIEVTGSSPLLLSANGSGAGSGGEIILSSTNLLSSVTIGSNAGEIQVSATGGSAGSASGDAGRLHVVTGGQINVDSTGLSLGPQGLNGIGAQIKLVSTDGAISLVNGPLGADGIGTGAGGSVLVSAATMQGAGFISANGGTAGGDGGTVELSVLSDLSIGEASAQLKLSANGGGNGAAAGNGGRIAAFGNNLEVDSTGISVLALGANGDGGQISVAASGNLSLSGGLSASGAGDGAGGKISLLMNSSDAFVIDSANALQAESGKLAGAGGLVSVTNTGSGGILVTTDANISVSPSLNGGDGGHIALSSPNGPLTLLTGLDVSSRTGDFNGGTITLEGAPLLTSPAEPISLTANGTGSGNGGKISVVSRGQANLQVGEAPGSLILSATGGSSGSLAGDGGEIAISVGQDLTVDASWIASGPLGISGAGGSISLNAGSDFSGSLRVAGDLSVDSKGDADGGSIKLAYNDSGVSSFTVGTVLTGQSGVAGGISADAPGAGKGGNISFFNNSTEEGAALQIEVFANLTAASIKGDSGNIILTGSMLSPVSLIAYADVAGSINAEGADVYIASEVPGQTLNVGKVHSAGSVLVSTTSDGSISLASDSSIFALGNVGITTASLTNNGIVESYLGDITVGSLAGSGAFQIAGDGIYKTTLGSNISLVSMNSQPLTISGSLEFDPGYEGKVTFQAPVITVSEKASVSLVNELPGLGASQMRFMTGTLHLNADSVIANFGTRNGPGIVVTDGGLYPGLTVIVPSGGAASIVGIPSTGDGGGGVISFASFAATPPPPSPCGGCVNISFAPSDGTSVTFAASGVDSGTLNLLGAQAGVKTLNADIIVPGNITLFADNELTLEAASGSVFLDGVVRTAPAEIGTRVSLVGQSVFLHGALSTHSGDEIHIRPDVDVAIQVGGAIKTDKFTVTQTEIDRVAAGFLNIGSINFASGIELISDIDISQGGLNELSFLTGGDVVASGRRIALGDSSLKVTAYDTVNGGTITGHGSNVNLGAGAVVIESIDVGTGKVWLRPLTNATVTVGTESHLPGAFDVTSLELQQISAGSLKIGNRNVNADISVVDNLDTSGTGGGAYDLLFETTGSFFSAGKAINLGTKSLTILADTLTDLGSVSGDSGTVHIETGTLNLQAPVNVGLDGKVVLKPSFDMPIVLGGTSRIDGEFGVTLQDLALITAGTLNLGDIRRDGGISLAGDIDLSGAAGSPGAFNLELETLGSYSPSGFKITQGEKHLTIYQSGGTINSSTGNLDLTRVLATDSPALTMKSGFFALAGGSISTRTTDPITVDLTLKAGTSIDIGADGKPIATGSSATGGDVNLSNVNFQLPGGVIDISGKSGSQNGGSVSVGSITSQSTGDEVQIRADSKIVTGGITLTAADGGGTSDGDAGAGVDSSNVFIYSASGNVAINGGISVQGGAGGSVFESRTGGNGGQGGRGGDIKIVAEKGSIQITGDLKAVGGNGGFGGPGVSGVQSVSGGNGGAGGNGGTVSLTATEGQITINGRIDAAGGNGGGASFGEPGGHGGDGGRGGAVTLRAATGKVSVIGGIDSSGGGAGGTYGDFPLADIFVKAGAGGGGGAAGEIEITAKNGVFVNADLLATGGGGGGGTVGNVGTTPAGRDGGSSASAAGGRGGQPVIAEHPDLLQVGSGGGGGGAGANIKIATTFGDVVVTGMINASGGGGGGGGGGLSPLPAYGGAGGAGGGSGAIKIETGTGKVNVAGPLLAAGGGGGGEGWAIASGGGGGGAFGGGGGAGSGAAINGNPRGLTRGISSGGGGGIGGGGRGSDRGSLNYGGSSTQSGSGLPGQGQDGFVLSDRPRGLGGTFGRGGTAPYASAGGRAGVGGGSAFITYPAEANIPPVFLPGGEAGTAGSVDITAQHIALTGSISMEGSPFAGFSIVTAGRSTGNGSGNVTLSRWSLPSTERYGANGDFGGTMRDVPATLQGREPLTLNAPVTANNGVAGKIFLTGQYSDRSEQAMNINRAGSLFRINSGDNVTPAEWVVAIQSGLYGAQTLRLAENGSALRGRIEVAPSNLPSGGKFTTLSIPANVTASVTAPLIGATKQTVIAGSLIFEAPGTLQTPEILVSGRLQARGDSPELTLKSLAGGDLKVDSTGTIRVAREGKAGVLQVLADGNLKFHTAKTLSIQALGTNGGDGGTVTMKAGLAGSATLELAGSVNVSGRGKGDGGSVFLRGGSLLTNGSVRADAGTEGAGGDISMQATGALKIQGGSAAVISALGGSTSGDGGFITFDGVELVDIKAKSLTVNSRGDSGDAGGISILSNGNIYVTAPDKITAAAHSKQGDGGAIVIKSQGDYIIVSGDVDISSYHKGDAGVLDTDPNTAVIFHGYLVGLAKEGDAGYWRDVSDSDKELLGIQMSAVKGNGGIVILGSNKGKVNIKGNVNISSLLGHGGFLNLSAKTTVTVDGHINSSSFSPDPKADHPFSAGKVRLEAGGNISVKEGINASSTGIRAGSIYIHSNKDGHGSSAFSIGEGVTTNGIGGDVNLSTRGTVETQIPEGFAQAGYLFVQDDGAGITVGSGASINLRTLSALDRPPGIVLVAPTGTVEIKGNLRNDGSFTARGGGIAISADIISLANNSLIASSGNKQTGGKGGLIELAAHEIRVAGTATVAAEGIRGGTVNVVARENLGISVLGLENENATPLIRVELSSTLTNAPLTIKGGALNITAIGNSGGGKINVNAFTLLLQSGSLNLTATATKDVSGGEISVKANDLRVLNLAQLTANVSGFGGADAGNIKIHSSQDLQSSSQMQLTANSAKLQAGTISIDSDSGSVNIDAAIQLNGKLNGNLNITAANDVLLSGTIESKSTSSIVTIEAENGTIRLGNAGQTDAECVNNFETLFLFENCIVSAA